MVRRPVGRVARLQPGVIDLPDTSKSQARSTRRTRFTSRRCLSISRGAWTRRRPPGGSVLTQPRRVSGRCRGAGASHPCEVRRGLMHPATRSGSGKTWIGLQLSARLRLFTNAGCDDPLPASLRPMWQDAVATDERFNRNRRSLRSWGETNSIRSACQSATRSPHRRIAQLSATATRTV